MAETNFSGPVNSAAGFKVGDVTVIDASGNIDAPVTTTDLTTTGNSILGDAVTDTHSLTGSTTITTTSANGLTVGRQGATSPVLKINAATASVATGVEVIGAASGSGVAVNAIGGTNEALALAGKGTGAVQLGQATSVGVTLVADQPILDSSANELVKFTKAATAVNEITVANAATATAPSILATGGDTDVSLIIGGKGAGVVLARSLVSVKQGAPAAKTVSATLTAAELLTEIITVNQAGGATSAQQLPTAADLDAALPTFAAGDSFEFSVINTSTVDAEDASITTNTGWTLVGSMDIHAYSAAGSLNSSALFRARKTGTAAWTLYRKA